MSSYPHEHHGLANIYIGHLCALCTLYFKFMLSSLEEKKEENFL